jgi:hypothetical protein
MGQSHAVEAHCRDSRHQPVSEQHNAVGQHHQSHVRMYSKAPTARTMLWCCLCRCTLVQCALLPPWVASLRLLQATMHWDSWTQRWLTGDTQQQQEQQQAQAQQATGRS